MISLQSKFTLFFIGVGLAILSKMVLGFTKKERDDKTKLDRLKNLALFFGFIVMTASTACLYTIFFVAYLDPQKATVVFIDSLGEANIELIALLLGLPCVCYFFYHVRKSRKKLLYVLGKEGK